VERDDDMLDGLLCIQSARDVVHHLYLSLGRRRRRARRFYSFASRLVYVLLFRSLPSPFPRFAYRSMRFCTVKSNLQSDVYIRVVGLLGDLGRNEDCVGPGINRPVTHLCDLPLV
jgi:hypothetical protein